MVHAHPMPQRSHCHPSPARADSKPVVPDMKLTANVGSDRSWVWNAAADVSEGEPEAVTLAIRFANSDSKFQAMFSSCVDVWKTAC